jgi:trafficking protein particle complex subunit 11
VCVVFAYDVDAALVNNIVLGGEHSSGLIKGVPFGTIAPGINVTKTLYLSSSGAPGNRMVDISIRSQSTTSTTSTTAPLESMSEGSAAPGELADASESLQTLFVPTVEPFTISFGVVYRRALGERYGLADLETFEPTFWDDGEGGEAEIDSKIVFSEPWGLEVVDARLKKQVSPARHT